jgi:cytochrome c551/c552
MPIFEKRCFGCHTGEGVAAEEHDFSRVESLRAARTTIADEIATCSMPPRSPLDDGEASTLLLWAACADRTH